MLKTLEVTPRARLKWEFVDVCEKAIQTNYKSGEIERVYRIK